MTTFRFRWALVVAAMSVLLGPTAGRVDLQLVGASQLTVDGANSLSAPGNEDAALLVELGSPQGCAGALIHCVASPGRSSCK
jgi:hypothetical protein